MIGEVERLLDKRAEVDAPTHIGRAARMFRHAPNDAIGTPPILGYLFQIARKHPNDLVDFGAPVVVKCAWSHCRNRLQFPQKFN